MYEEENKPQTNPKKVGVVIALVFVALALIISSLSKIKIQRKVPKQTPNTTKVAEVESNNKVLKYIQNTSVLNLNSDIKYIDGRIVGKEMLLDGTQVVFKLSIDVGSITGGNPINYYCSYSVYLGVSNGDILEVSYMNPSESTITIVSATRK